MELKDVIQFYLPIQVELDNAGSKIYNRVAVAVGNTDDEYLYVTLRMGAGAKSFTHSVLLSENRVKPILRPLSDMTEEERGYLMEVANLEPEDLAVLNGGTAHLTTLKGWVATTNYMRKNGFDIDGLIEAGLAIDKTTLTPHKKTG